MKYFFKLNGLSILYALMIFIPLELMINVYRISRITNWNIGTVNMLTGITIIVEFIVGTILLFFLTKKWMKGRKSSFGTAILWIPYFVLFVYILASLFPVTYEGDVPSSATGLLAIGALIAFPFYVLIVNSMGITSKRNK
ncbi:hypothetical protein FHP05_11800 [Cerasibacillus terrae]|uniref:Uncharacterized protein n=1 Tax=Cerasibacillus terrae TaxID=2498845 RepID=A0A5C8NKU8_9BACI|nr:hypothetical protein [Cerasibacillus terrae]TXL62484.1 hypothetical protein FHP05_11800 [Cerasibacillus terrae]